MSTLEHLIDDARALAQGAPVAGSAEAEVARQLQICNACRYCEGFCAVFPAMTRRLTFGVADVHYLANLCHNCGACLHACQYAPPHDFGVNVPQAMAQVRARTYQDFAWPRAMGRLYQRNGLTVALALVLGLSLFLWLAASRSVAPGATFYDVFAHGFLVNVFAPVFVLALWAVGMGVRQFLRDITPVTGQVTANAAAQTEAASDVLTLRYLDGGHGEGCHNEDEAYTLSRRRAHHATFYGFLLCFAATSVATLQHYLFGMPAPYDWPALPKLLGVPGGVLLALGAARLLWLNWQRHPLHGDVQQRPMDRAFLVLLLLTSLSGLGLWLARTHTSMPLWLCVHLGSVMALFLTLPYGKMVHGFYRSAALLRYAVEKRLPNPIGLGND